MNNVQNKRIPLLDGGRCWRMTRNLVIGGKPVSIGYEVTLSRFDMYERHWSAHRLRVARAKLRRMVEDAMTQACAGN